MRTAAHEGLQLVCWLLALSPVLFTLTRTFSDDTFVALTITLFVLHVVTHDYGTWHTIFFERCSVSEADPWRRALFCSAGHGWPHGVHQPEADTLRVQVCGTEPRGSPCTSPESPLHLSSTSPAPPLHLPCTSPASPLHLPRCSAARPRSLRAPPPFTAPPPRATPAEPWVAPSL